MSGGPDTTCVELAIPTTGTTARILYLAQEDARLGRSTICIGGSAQQAGVDRDYNAFVRQPTGPIEKLFGHAAWRADVSDPVDAGQSWQLALFLAHAINAAGRLHMALADTPHPPSLRVWATGTVDTLGLRVGAIGHVETKARHILEEARPGLFLLPAENLPEIAPTLREALKKQGVQLIPVANAGEAVAALGLPPLPQAQAASSQGSSSGKAWNERPFRGLEAFEARHRPIFFGRARAREEATERMRRTMACGTAFLLVHGNSGVGKSSLAMAGLAEDITSGAREGAPWTSVVLRFDAALPPDTALRNALAEAMGGSTPESGQEVQSLAAALDRQGVRTLLLILDQLEQALLQPDTEAAASMAALVSELARSGRAACLATLRTDRFDLLNNLPELAALADGDRLYRLAPPSLGELGQIIRSPMALAGLRFEEADADLSDRLAELALASPDSLPLLQIVLTRLADLADESGVIPAGSYDRIGGFEGVVNRWADAVIDDLEAEGLSPAEIDRALAELVAVDTETGRGNARSARVEGAEPARMAVFDQLVEARLAVVRGHGPNRYVLLAHEALIRNWPRLSALVQTLGSELELRDRLEVTARQWDRDGRPPSDLLRHRGRLDAGEDLVAGQLTYLSPLALDFLARSRTAVKAEAEAEEEELRLGARRARITAGAAVAALLVVAGVAFWALEQRNAAVTQTRIAERQAVDLAQALDLAATREIEAETARTLAESRLQQAEAATRLAERRADLLTLESAPDIAAEGHRDAALLTALAASAAFVDDDTPPHAVLMSLEDTLQSVVQRTVIAVPADSTGQEFRDGFFLHSSGTGTLSRALPDGTLRNLGPLDGRLMGIFDALDPPGAMIAMDNAGVLEIHGLDPETGPTGLLFSLPGLIEGADYSTLTINPDGIGLIEQSLYTTDYTEIASLSAVFSIPRGEMREVSGFPPRLRFMPDGQSLAVAEATDESEDIEAYRAIGVQTLQWEDVPAGTLCSFHNRGGGIFGAWDEDLWLIERLFTDALELEHDPGAMRCWLSGEHLLLSSAMNTSAGRYAANIVVRLGQVDALQEAVANAPISDWRTDDGGLDLISNSQDFPETEPLGFTPTVLEEFAMLDWRVRDVTLRFEYEEPRHFRMPREISAAGLLSVRQAAVLLNPAPASEMTELVLIDWTADGPFAPEPLNEWARAELGLPAFDLNALPADWRPEFPPCAPWYGGAPVATLDLNEIPFEDRGDALIFSPETGEPPLVLPAPLDMGCASLSPDGAFFAIWHDEAIHVLARDGTSFGSIPSAWFRMGTRLLPTGDGPPDVLAPDFGLTLNLWHWRDGDWVAQPLLQMPDPISMADVDLATNRALVTIALGGREFRSVLYSLEEDRIWRDLGTGYREHFAAFLPDGQILNAMSAMRFLSPSFSLEEYRSLAREALSPLCAFDGDDPTISPCWRE